MSGPITYARRTGGCHPVKRRDGSDLGANNGTELIVSKLTVLNGHDDSVDGVAWSPDGQRLATASLDRTVRIWDGEYGAEAIIIGAHPAGVEGLS
jgi:WD40 repeat protein